MGNGIYGTKGSSTETHKNFVIHFDLTAGKFLKLIVTCLHCIKYNEINKFNSVVEKHVLYIGSQKRCLLYYWKRTEMYFKLCFMICFYHTKLSLYAYSVQRHCTVLLKNIRIFFLLLGITVGNSF